MSNDDLVQQMFLMQKQMNDRMNEFAVNRCTMLFSEHMNQWFFGKKAALSVNTYEKYQGLYRTHVEPAFRDLLLSDVDTNRLQMLVNGLIGVVSSSTIREIMSSMLSPAFKRAVGLDLIRKNPVDFVVCPKVKQQHNRPLSDNEICRLMVEARKHYLWIAVPLLIYTGIRRSEMLALTWDDIHFEQKEISISKGYVSTWSGENVLNGTKTEGSKRLVAIPMGLIALLREYRDTIGQGRTYVVSQVKNDKMVNPDNFSRTFRRWCDKAGIKGISPHSTRHTYCTICQEQGLDTFTIMRQVGHTTSRMLEQVYVHMRTNELQQRGAEKVGAAIDKVVCA